MSNVPTTHTHADTEGFVSSDKTSPFYCATCEVEWQHMDCGYGPIEWGGRSENHIAWRWEPVSVDIMSLEIFEGQYEGREPTQKEHEIVKAILNDKKTELFEGDAPDEVHPDDCW